MSSGDETQIQIKDVISITSNRAKFIKIRKSKNMSGASTLNQNQTESSVQKDKPQIEDKIRASNTFQNL